MRPSAEPGGARRGDDPDIGAARAVLESLADVAVGRTRHDAAASFARFPGGRADLAAWLQRIDMAPLALAAARPCDSELAALLTRHGLGAAAANLLHFATLARVERRFAEEHVAMVLLKGAAVASCAYADVSFRPMTDIDLWVRDEDMPHASELLRAEGFRQDPGLPDRPPALQRRSGGELGFRPAHGATGLVELHFSPFQGWWIQRTAAPDLDGIWRRCQPTGSTHGSLRLAHEDAILQTSFHIVVNQFGQAPMRGLMDLAVLARAYRIDWALVAERAIRWRLATATWLALDMAERLIGVPGSAGAIEELRPAAARRALVRTFMTPPALLSGRDLTRASRRHPFMLAVADRARDGARLAGRALWPEPWWVEARHGTGVGRWGHIRRILRRGDV